MIMLTRLCTRCGRYFTPIHHDECNEAARPHCGALTDNGPVCYPCLDLQLTVETAIYRQIDAYSGPRYSAHVILEGETTSWTCTHLHRSELTAAGCLTRLRYAAQTFLDGATITTIDGNLREGRNGAVSRRWRQPLEREQYQP